MQWREHCPQRLIVVRSTCLTMRTRGAILHDMTEFENSPIAARAAQSPRKWLYGQILLILCLISGCWGIVANYELAVSPPVALDKMGPADQLGVMLTVLVAFMSIPVLVRAPRGGVLRRYVVMAGFEVAQFLGGPIVVKTAAMTPAQSFWMGAVLSVVEAVIAVLALGFPLMWRRRHALHNFSRAYSSSKFGVKTLAPMLPSISSGDQNRTSVISSC